MDYKYRYLDFESLGISLHLLQNQLLFCRYAVHFAKLVDSMHILNSTQVHISESKRKKANKLLLSFVEDFEDLYGEDNMVYNVHQLKHVGECVVRNAPLFTYSNYPMEDYIGHLVSFVKGTTDVSSQICSRYLLEKNLHFILQKSQLALEFYRSIESRLSFSISRKVNESLVIGKPKRYNLNGHELAFVQNVLQIDDTNEFYE